MSEGGANDSVLLITGASSGIGAATVRAAPGATAWCWRRGASRSWKRSPKAVMYALEQRPGVDVNEILIRPTSQPS